MPGPELDLRGAGLTELDEDVVHAVARRRGLQPWNPASLRRSLSGEGDRPWTSSTTTSLASRRVSDSLSLDVIGGVDISGEAISAVRKNATLNNLEVEAVEANVFDFLKACENQYDLIILDPPSFTRSKKALTDAMRGYKEINLRALKLLDRDGYLSTYSCSHHVTRSHFFNSINDASVDAKRSLRLVKSHSQRCDHPILLSIPETEYLKGFTFQLLPPR